MEATSDYWRAPYYLLEDVLNVELINAKQAKAMPGRKSDVADSVWLAMIGRFGEHHAFLCRLHLDRIDQLERDMAKLSTRIEEVMAPFHDALNQLATIPGVSQRVAEVIIAETGGDMSRFPTAAHLASWAGVCPGNHESGGRRKSGKTRKGNRWLRDALGTSALAATRSKGTYLGAQYARLVRRLGSKQKALVALQHSILTSVWHMLSANASYQDLASDYFLRRDPERERRRAITALNKLGYTVTLNPIEPTQTAA